MKVTDSYRWLQIVTHFERDFPLNKKKQQKMPVFRSVTGKKNV